MVGNLRIRIELRRGILFLAGLSLMLMLKKLKSGMIFRVLLSIIIFINLLDVGFS